MTRESLYLTCRSINKQLFNPSVIKHNKFNCHIATAKLCGTHWVKYMLSWVLAEIYDLPPPAHIRDDSIVGHTKHRPQYEAIPQIAVTHSHPHYLLRASNIFRVMNLPRFIILVRDPRDILVSMYEKSRGEHLNKKMSSDIDVTFSRFIRGDVTGKTRIGDIWQIMLFFNSWGPITQSHKDEVIAIKYEDMKENTQETLARICQHIGIEGATEEIIANAIAKSAKDKMQQKLDENETMHEKSVNLGQRDFKTWYNEQDRAFINDSCTRYLKDDFGYKITTW